MSDTDSFRKRLGNKKIALTSTVIIFVLSAWLALTCTSFGIKFFKWSSRKLVVRLLGGVLDFNDYHTRKCLVNNHLKTPDSAPIHELCDLCENVDDVNMLHDNATRFDADSVGVYLQTNSPFVFHDMSQNGGKRFSLASFVDAFVSVEGLSHFHPCQYQSNWKSKVSDHWGLMKLIARQEVTSFYALWENCADLALKEFRHFYKRPSLLGANIQLTGTNWAILCSDFGGKIYRHIELFSPIAVLLVYEGTLDVKLQPFDECQEMCSTIHLLLKAGDTLVFSASIHKLLVLPQCLDSATLAIGVGGYTD